MHGLCTRSARDVRSRPLAIGDSYMPAHVFAEAFAWRGMDIDTVTIDADRAPHWPLDGLRESEGDPAQVSELIAGREIVVLHGAPVSRAVLAANPALRLVGCARGGPVNVDIVAARELGVAVTTSPGKNASAVADYTLGGVILGLRRIPPSVRSVDDVLREGGRIAESTFEGARWCGAELSNTTLGLVGFGNVARLVSARAIALGMKVSAFDPFAETLADGVQRATTLDELLERSQVVSVHARATADNRRLIGAPQFARMPDGVVFINSARESLVDEGALLAAVRSGRVAAAVLDVCEPDGCWRELVREPTVVLTPHIAGATRETLARGAGMIADEVLAFLDGNPLRWAA